MDSTARPARRRGRWAGAAAVAVSLVAAVSLATTSGASTGGCEPAAAAKKALERFVELWNAGKIDEVVAVSYTDDAILIPPNHEVVTGKAAITEYLKGARQAVGEFDPVPEPLKVTELGDSVSVVRKNFSFRSGAVRVNSHELWVCQDDGSSRVSIDMFGLA